MLPLIVMSPFLLTPAAYWLGRKRAPWAMLLAIWPACLAIYFGTLMSSVAASGPFESSLNWAPSLGLALSFYVDGLSVLFALLIAAIGSLIVAFSSQYFDGEPGAGRFQATLFAFMGSMLGVVLANNLFAMFVFWELTGFTSFLLIGFDHERAEARASAIQALIVTGTGGMALLAAAVLIEGATGAVDLSVLLAGNFTLQTAQTYPWIVLLLLFAAFTKSAQTPFHFWLPNAMAAPTPASAYLHSATMVKAGLYLVARMTPLAGATPMWIGLAVAAGAITMALGAWRAVAEADLKRVLAYSTVSALGLLMMLLGIGTPAAITAALVYLIAHACYKGALFLVAGTIEHETGTRDVTDLGGLCQSMPVIACAGALAAGSMAGIPLFLGFIGKELLYETLLGDNSFLFRVLLAAAIGASALLGSTGLIAGVSPFFGLAREAAGRHRVPLSLAAPPLLLAMLALAAGVWPSGIDVAIGLAVSRVVRSGPAVHLALWHGLTPALALSLTTLLATIILYRWRDSIRQNIWPRSLGFEKLYSYSLRALDAVSAASLPALQSASLRSYVLALVATAALLLAVVVSSGLPSVRSAIRVGPTEAAAALLIVAGAISAVRARATMTAVLSLSMVGYGVALIFVLFGAPDLAMTQFSVETLTAVIFVLVFYHFREFRSLSPRAVRIRDSVVAVLFGSSIASVLLFVGVLPTPVRLASYFTEASVPLAHGRNIVNVILVDFRALDTLGEITVLATAALGVRAVLRIGRHEERKS